MGCGQLSVRDCGSTNGTFVDGIPVREAVLLRGQTLRLGDFELLVADTEVPISIPKFEMPIAAPPVVLENGSILCHRHRANAIAYRCQHCRELLCEDCLHRLRRRGGKLLCLCPVCSASLFDDQFPGGDKAGNDFYVRPNSKGIKLHALWDGLLGTSSRPGPHLNYAIEIQSRHCRSPIK